MRKLVLEVSHFNFVYLGRQLTLIRALFQIYNLNFYILVKSGFDKLTLEAKTNIFVVPL